ncbi:MAG TPA: hypothetical protein VIP53_00190 [Nitrososphaera sp.]
MPSLIACGANSNAAANLRPSEIVPAATTGACYSTSSTTCGIRYNAPTLPLNSRSSYLRYKGIDLKLSGFPCLLDCLNLLVRPPAFETAATI